MPPSSHGSPGSVRTIDSHKLMYGGEEEEDLVFKDTVTGVHEEKNEICGNNVVII
jgi:hypothetical protein